MEDKISQGLSTILKESQNFILLHWQLLFITGEGLVEEMILCKKNEKRHV